MEIEKMTKAEILAYAKKLPDVKPMATAESVASFWYDRDDWDGSLSAPEVIKLLKENLDWSTPSREWEKNLRLGRLLDSVDKKWHIFTVYESIRNGFKKWQFIPFDPDKVGKVTE